MSALQPFSDLVRADASGCWIWTGPTNKTTGYGSYGSRTYAHRYSYELYVGPIPEGLTIDHLCRVRNCVNPDHLEAVTIAENIARSNNHSAQLSARTACANGHEYVAGSFRWVQPKYRANTSRVCLVCGRENERRYYRARLAKKEVAS